MDIAVIGAGLGGLAAAAALLQQGHRVRVYEQSAQLAEVGAGIQMSANAMKVLDRLGLRRVLEPVAVRPLAFEFRRFDSGEMLHRLPLGEAHEQRHGAPYFQLHRADLHGALQQAVAALDAGALVLGARATALDETADGVRVGFDDGNEVHAELVVGADGIRSVVRSHVLADLGADRPRFTGQVAWRLTVPTERIPPALRTDLVSTIWCGPRNHAVTYYLRAGELLNFVGCVERGWEEESWTARRPWHELDADYPGWHPMVRAVVEHADREECYRWALNNREPSLRWSSARVTLLGDAVHATLPYMAQGAAMAIEDAAVLARALALPGPLAERLRRYEAHRAPRAARVVRESTEMGELYHIVDADEMRKAFVARDIARSRNEWLYPYEPWQAPL
ncbi:MAG: FAD-dependent monooxygenase [Burkholderiales bacterium]|nr:FAD-dependent monooxygenase [Burkholderiales bacterium]